MRQVTLIGGLLFVLASLLLVSIDLGEAHALQPLSELFKEAGLGSTDIDDRQKELARQMGQLYEDMSEIESQNEAIMSRIGGSMPDAVDKNQLRVLAGNYIGKLNKLEKLKLELTHAVADSAAQKSLEPEES